jgi:DNA primase
MNEIEEIKNRLDIVEFIGGYIQLKKAGANYKALCPFHNEKTPSLMVSPEKQIWHCFGCQKGGDIFTFKMEMDHVDFGEALEELAERTGVKLQRRNFLDPEKKSRKKILMEINEAAAKFFQAALLHEKIGKKAREYLENRGLTAETISSFRLGFAPDLWDGVTKALPKKGFSEKEIAEAGLIIAQQKQDKIEYFDRFRGRLMIPITNIAGQIVGFTGRLLADAKDLAKYVNSPETSIFSKGKIVFALDRAKAEITARDLAIVVEGHLDVIASHQAGVKNVVASGGTALTLDQLKLISRYTQNIAFAFDQDEAGFTALAHAVDLSRNLGLNIKVVKIPFGKDPDECIKKDASLWKAAAESPISYYDFIISKIAGKLNLETLDEQKKAVSFWVSELSKEPDPLTRAHFISKIAALVNKEEKVIAELVEKARLKNLSPKRAGKNEQSDFFSKSFLSEDHLLERLWALLVLHPLNSPYAFSSLADIEMGDSVPELLLESLKRFCASEAVFDDKKYLNQLPPDLQQAAQKIIAREVFVDDDPNLLQEEIAELVLRYKERKLVGEKRKLTEEIKKAEAENNSSLVKELLARYKRLVSGA